MISQPGFARDTGPDVLEVISNLSSDEVFTPPRIVNEMLDLLPDEVWRNPELRWLDPACKTGVFLREVTRRLMVGLIDAYPDENDRLGHILKEMIFGIAITEITSLMTRRTIYCSKDASSENSVPPMEAASGNVWFERLAHDFDSSGRCRACNATQTQFGDISKETHAYGFIHPAGHERIKGSVDMRFDVIVGNPPYQMDAESGNRTMPIYHLFVEEAKKLNPQYMAFIIPSRWMAGGLGLADFRETMLSDKRVRSLVDYPKASEVFPGVEIKGGVCYFLWDRDHHGDCQVTLKRGGTAFGPVSRELGQFDVLVRDSRALAILEKVLARDEPSITELLAADKEFGMTSNFSGYSAKRSSGAIELYLVRSGRRSIGWMKRSAVSKSAHLIDTWKLLVPKAGSDGGQTIPDSVLGSPIVAGPPSACTQTYLFFYVDSEAEAHSIEMYMKTRFFRFLVSLRKISQDATRSTYTWVPQQSWDTQWTDEKLYEKYGIDDEERAYIESMIKGTAE
jgi:site-specific DNA-methyltransferase (adenine-specific)